MAGVIVYSSPFVPPEWIAAHGLAPHRLLPDAIDTDIAQGICPFAHDFVACGAKLRDVRGIIVASSCDQMRRSAERLAIGSTTPVFLLNVPATWQGEGLRQLYRDEILRLGRFLVTCGGAVPSDERLIETMRQFDSWQRTLLAARAGMTARQYVEAICQAAQAVDAAPAMRIRNAGARVRVALVGGPLRRPDFWIYDLIDQLGAEVVLDATETAERGLPAPFDEDCLRIDPLGELVRAYFDTIPDAFRRPDSLLQEYLRRHLARRGTQGVILVRYAWCDHWHAQRSRLKEDLSLPLVEVDLGGRDEQLQRTRTRIETLVSILR